MAKDTDKRWKGLLQHWPTVENMDTVDYAYKALNQQQVAILLAAISPYRWNTRWIDLGIEKDELDKLIADIELRLMMEESMSIDYEAWYDANKRAIYDALNDVAKQIVSGRVTNIAVGDDGTVTDPTTGDPIDAPDDDPATPQIDEGLSANAGGAIKVVDYLQEILTNMHAWFIELTSVNSQLAAERLVLFYNYDQVKADAFADYWFTVYANSSGTVLLNQVVLDEWIYCKGNKPSTLARYALQSHSVSAEVPVLLKFTESLDQSMLTAWFNEGMAVGSTDYLIYSCTKIADEIITFDMSTADNVQRTTAGVWKAGHRYLINLSGSYADSDAPTHLADGMYFINLTTGLKTFSSIIFGNNVAEPVQAAVPYSSAHNYSFTVEKLGGDEPVLISRDNGANMAIPNVTGILTMEIIDLGEFEI